MNERFSPDEWRELKLLPVRAFNFALLRLARERPDALDAAQAQTFFRGFLVAKPIEPLFRELMEDVDEADWPGLVSEAAASDILDLMEPLERTRAMLSDRLSRKEYNTFLGSVVQVAIIPFQGLPAEARSVWMGALADLTKLLDVDLKAAARALGRAQEGSAARQG